MLVRLAHRPKRAVHSNRLRDHVCLLYQRRWLPVAPFFVVHQHQHLVAVNVGPTWPCISGTLHFTLRCRAADASGGKEPPLPEQQTGSCAKAAPPLPLRLKVTPLRTRLLVLLYFSLYADRWRKSLTAWAIYFLCNKNFKYNAEDLHAPRLRSRKLYKLCCPHLQ